MVGTAMCCIAALSARPARAGTAPELHVLAMHGEAVVKSAMRPHQGGTHTQTFSATIDISTSADDKVKTPVAFFDVSTSILCVPP